MQSNRPFSWTFFTFMSKYQEMKSRALESEEQSKPSKKYIPPKMVKPEHQAFLTKVGTRLEAMRKETEMSTTELCKKSGISRYTYYLIIRGHVYWNALSILNIMAALNRDESQIFIS